MSGESQILDIDPKRLSRLHEKASHWYQQNARALPWRSPGTSPWGILVSEIMAQQTPVSRVAPQWIDWMRRWPTPAALAAASPAQVVRAWDRLGYPRRALRLHECAVRVVEKHGGILPSDETALRALPGIGEYTAAAVASFAFSEHSVVVDTNIRRVHARLIAGKAQAKPSLSVAERKLAQSLIPKDSEQSVVWNEAIMELGALVCTAREARCVKCPLTGECSWFNDGKPADEDLPKRKTQRWAGTDRQVRGKIMAVLRTATEPVHRPALEKQWPQDRRQFERCLASLISDGLAEQTGDAHFALPGEQRGPSVQAQ